MEVTKRFAEFVVQTRFEDIPAEERRLAGQAMFDALGVMIAAVTEPAGRLIILDVQQTQHALGIVASSSAGVCANFGYYTKSLHAGQTGRNGVIAAELAARGWTASPEAIERKVGWADAFYGLENFDPE